MPVSKIEFKSKQLKKAVKMRGYSIRWRWISSVGATLFAVTALVAALVWPKIFDAVLATQVALIPDSRSFKEWVAPTVPLFFKVYIFNWTNPEEFPRVKPHLEELGPYTFRENREHVNITWHPENGSISYRTKRSWYFDAEASNGTLEDSVTIVNVISASALYSARFWNVVLKWMMDKSLDSAGQKISVTKPLRKLLFEGYDDPLLDMAKMLPSSLTGDAPKVDKFGLFYERNNSIDTDGFMEVTSGEDGRLPGQILRWNHQDSLEFYEGKCAKLQGSAGEFVPRNLTDEHILTMFLPDLCRTVHMEHTESGELNGLQYKKYEMTESSFDNSTLTSDNTCFCHGECAWGGVLNVSACRYGAPAFLSLPHFLRGDPALREAVTGMRPDPSRHSFYFAVEPKLGVPLDVAGRFQFNVLIEPSSKYPTIPRMLFPVFWVEQHVMPEDRIFDELRVVRSILEWGGTFCICVGLFFALLATLAVCSGRKPKYAPPLELTIGLEKPKDEAELKLNPM